MGNQDQDATKICSECGLKVSGDAATCEHCGNVFRKLPRTECESEKSS